MEALRSGDFDVFAYESMLHTRAPLLRWLYCESHAYEPFAVHGLEARQGEYRFRNVLWVPHAQREALLDDVFDHALDPAWTRQVERRFDAEGRRLVRALVRTRRDATRDTVTDLLQSAARFLSVGVFKEALSDEGLALLLGQFLPDGRVRPFIPALWQPRCQPHFLTFELRALFALERLQRGEADALRSGIARAAHHARFLVEDTPFHEPAAFQRHLEELERAHPRESPRRLRLERRAEHFAARQRADEAEAAVVASLDDFGRHTLGTKLKVHGLLRFVRFLATTEELKHVLLVETARRCRLLMDERGLDLEQTMPAELLDAVSSR